jgi:hypothetical protein
MGTSEGHQKKTKNSFKILATDFAGSTQNLKKIIETKKFSNKVCLVPQK